jgi:hypothetical protein
MWGYLKMNSEWKPWEDYPNIWPTKSKFFTWLRGSLRNAVWNKSPIKIIFKNEACSAPPDGYDGRAKSGAYCALSGKWEGKSKLEIDHIEGNVSLNDEGDILDFLKHLIPPPNSLQCVTKEAHKIKSHAERKGISYEESEAEKKAIQLEKAKTDKAYILEKGETPERNAKLRREQLVRLILGDEDDIDI